LLYSLKFDEAQQNFSQWQQQNPTDPMGPASEGAGLLFSELDRLGILESQFFEDDKSFADRKKVSPDAAVHGRFQAALDRARPWRRRTSPRTRRITMRCLPWSWFNGLQADYTGLIEKRNFASLSYTKQGTNWAAQLLAVDPNAYDAYLARGLSRYIIGSLFAPFRWLLHLGGVEGNKERRVGRRAVDGGSWPLFRALCAHPAGDRVRAGQRQRPGPPSLGFLARRLS